MWNIEKLVSKGDYTYAVVRDHPNRTKLDYVFEHRVLMENKLGRLLLSTEIVHHIDGNKKNNSIENLEVMASKEHNRQHTSSRGKKMCLLKCPECNELFTKEYRHAIQSAKKEVWSVLLKTLYGKIFKKSTVR